MGRGKITVDSRPSTCPCRWTLLKLSQQYEAILNWRILQKIRDDISTKPISIGQVLTNSSYLIESYFDSLLLFLSFPILYFLLVQCVVKFNISMQLLVIPYFSSSVLCLYFYSNYRYLYSSRVYRTRIVGLVMYQLLEDTGNIHAHCLVIMYLQLLGYCSTN